MYFRETYITYECEKLFSFIKGVQSKWWKQYLRQIIEESHRVIYTPNKMQYFIFNQFIHMPNYSLIGFSVILYNKIIKKC